MCLVFEIIPMESSKTLKIPQLSGFKKKQQDISENQNIHGFYVTNYSFRFFLADMSLCGFFSRQKGKRSDYSSVRGSSPHDIWPKNSKQCLQELIQF
jgi:hypothetical protein